jgi:acyl-CoA reductase-like NAD-dependent aldehyde dehydrogenase
MQTPISGAIANVPAWIESSANISQAVTDIFLSKTFEHGAIPTSEQAIVCDRAIQAIVMAECARQGGCFLSPEEQEKLDTVMWVEGQINPLLIGQSAIIVARQAGISVPASTRILLAPLTTVGPDAALSATKPFPVLAFYSVVDRDAALDRCQELAKFGSLEPTIALHTQDQTVIAAMNDRLPTHRCLVNQPAAADALPNTEQRLAASNSRVVAPFKRPSRQPETI